jgi:BASS family bile acid:Na+ symporter
MTSAQLVTIALQASIVLNIFCVALSASVDDVGYLLRRPGLLLRSLLAMNVIMPALAVGIAIAFDLNPFVEAALIALALSPVPPVSPKKEIQAGGAASYILGVLVATSLLSIVFVPAAAEVVGRIFDRPIHTSARGVAKIVATSMLLPLAAGVCVRLAARSLAQKIARPLSIVATVVLAVALVPVLIQQWPRIVSLVGNFSIVAIVVFVLAGLAVGHLLGGPDPDDRSVLALSTATRHPAVALLIVREAVDKQSTLAAVLLAMLVGAIVSVPYVKWRKRSHEARQPPARPRTS